MHLITIFYDLSKTNYAIDISVVSCKIADFVLHLEYDTNSISLQ